MPMNIVTCKEDGTPTPRSSDGTPINAPTQWMLGQSRFLRTDDGTALMNVNGAPAGTPLIVWNGTGAGDTGGDWTRGGTAGQVESTESAHSGTNGLDTGERSNGETTNFSTTDFDIQASYDSLSFWINPKRKDSGTSIRLRWYLNGGTVGTLVIVDDYVTNFDLDVWQKVTIPLSDFSLPESQLVDELQILYYGLPASRKQRYFFDDFELNPAGAGGGPYTFQVSAEANEKCHVSMMVLLLSGASSGWSSTSFANTTALTNGLILRQRRISTAEVLWSINSKDNTDMFGRFHPQDAITFNDGVLLVGFMIKPGGASVVITDDDVLEFIVSDDLSSLESARAFVHYGKEVIA
jgi:hypothetical protein